MNNKVKEIKKLSEFNHQNGVKEETFSTETILELIDYIEELEGVLYDMVLEGSTVETLGSAAQILNRKFGEENLGEGC